MEFLTILIALGLLQLWGSGGPFQQDRWFENFTETTVQLTTTSIIRLFVIIGVPAIVLMVITALVKSQLFGILSLIVYVFVLLFSLGRGDFSENIQRYLSAWEHGNFESAYERAIDIGDFKQCDTINDHVSLHKKVRQALVYEGFERWFAVVFWFLLLGPVGALVYRLSYLAGRTEYLSQEDRQLSLELQYYLDWIPARLLMISFALTGNFVNAFSHCSQSMFDNQPVDELVDGCAIAAISGFNEQRNVPEDEDHFISFGKKEMQAVQALLSRSVVCWLVVIALMTMFVT